MTSPVEVLGWVDRVGGVGVALSATEWLAVAEMWTDDGPLARRIRRPRTRRVHGMASVQAAVSGPGTTRWLLMAQVVGVVGILLPASAGLHRAALAAMVVTTLILRPRLALGNDGADQLLSIALTASLLARLLGTRNAATLVLWFLALEVCLAYSTSGWGKLRQRDWRNGAVIRDVLSTVLFGAPRVGAWLQRRPAAAAWLSRLVIANFVLFPLVLVLPRPLALALLACGAAFHVAAAAVMGITRFPFAFIATYPAVMYCARF